MEVENFLIHVLGILIILFIIDYEREKNIISLTTKKGWFIMLLVTFAVTLIKHK